MAFRDRQRIETFSNDFDVLIREAQRTARDFPDFLTEPEVAQWREHCQCQRREGSFPLAQFKVELAKERARPELTELTANALDQLERWVETLSVEG